MWINQKGVWMDVPVTHRDIHGPRGMRSDRYKNVDNVIACPQILHRVGVVTSVDAGGSAVL
jgi:hypothetical protein